MLAANFIIAIDAVLKTKQLIDTKKEKICSYSYRRILHGHTYNFTSNDSTFWSKKCTKSHYNAYFFPNSSRHLINLASPPPPKYFDYYTNDIYLMWQDMFFKNVHIYAVAKSLIRTNWGLSWTNYCKAVWQTN